MFITPSFKKSLIVEQFQGNYLKRQKGLNSIFKRSMTFSYFPPSITLSKPRADVFKFWTPPFPW